jgi:hypothetical protein
VATTVEITDFVTVPDQPIVSVGMDFPVSTGVITVTEDDLLDVVASQKDVAVKAPRLKLGHGIKGTLNDPIAAGGGDPAFGRIENLRYNADDMTLYGDYVSVPAWLAEIMPHAYANRSFEGAQGAETVTGKKWRLVITAVSLLGVSWPGISTLPDLMAAFSPDGPEGVTVTPVITAQADVDDVRREFYDTVAIGDQFWWWIRAMLIDPNEIIVDNDDGVLYRISYEIADDGEVSFGEPQAVKIVYEDVPAKQAAAIAAQGMIASRGAAIAARYDNRAESRIDATQKEDEKMDPKILEKLGLGPDADPEDVIAAVDKLRADATVPTGETEQPAPAEPTAPGDGEEDGGEEPAPVSNPETPATPAQLMELAAKHGLTVVDNATLEQIKAGAAAGSKLAAEKATESRDRLIAAAVKDGKIPPARRDHWAGLYDADPEGTSEMLAKMAAVIPLSERGIAATSETDAAGSDEYPRDWLSPSEQSRIAAATAAPGSGRVLTERGDA